MGYTSRGASVPSGVDQPTATPTLPAPTLAPTAVPAPPARIDRAAVAAQARADREQALRDRWNEDYSASKPVPSNGYQVTPEEKAEMEAAGIPLTPKNIATHAARLTAQAQSDAIRQAEEADRQQNAAATTAREAAMSDAERRMRDSGQRYFIDSNRTVQPIKDAVSGRPLYNPTGWEEGVHPETGQPVLTMRDRYGQTQYKTPPIVHNPDLTDNQLYYKFPSGKMTPAGSMDDLVKSPDFAIKRAAIKAVGQRRSAQWKEAVAPMDAMASQAKVNHDMAGQQVLDLQDKSQKLQDEINQLNVNPQLNETAGGIMGVGAKPTDASQALQAQLAAKQDEKKRADDQTAQLQASLKPTGQLGRAKRQADLSLGIFKSQAQHDNYANLADQRRAFLQSQGLPEAGDPTLAAILKAQDTFKAAISRYSDVAKTEGVTTSPVPTVNAPTPVAPTARGAHPLNPAPPRLTDDQRIRSTGTRLDLGAPVPGRPGAFESLPAPPHANDPVVDPDNPNAPAPPASKVTLSQTDLPASDAEVAGKFQEFQDKMAPTLDLMGKASAGIDAVRAQEAEKGTTTPGPGQQNEPFALAQKGVTHMGGVSVDELGKRYGAGNGPVAPLSLLKMKQRITDIDKTLEGSNQLDGKVQQSMKEERDYLTSLATQRFSRLSVADQNRVTEASRPATNWEIAKANVSNFARDSGTQATDIVEGLGKMALRSVDVMNPASLTRLLGDFKAPLLEKIDEYSRWEKNAIEESHAPTTSAEEKAQSNWTAQLAGTVGGFVPYLVGGAAAKVAGAPAALQSAVSGVMGAVGIGQSVRDEARAGLQKQLDAGKITKEDFNRGLNQAEGIGTIIGSSMMVPFGQFTKIVGKTAIGQKLVSTILEKMGAGGQEAAAKWLGTPEAQGIFRRVMAGTAESAVTGFAQSVATNLSAQGKFGNVAYDPSRGTFQGSSESALSLGLLGAMHSAMHAGTLKGSIQEVADAAPGLFWKTKAGSTPAEYVEAARAVRTTGGTPEQVELVNKVESAAKAQGIKLGDVVRGRVGATTSETTPRFTHDIFPESLKPTAPKGEVEFKRTGATHGRPLSPDIPAKWGKDESAYRDLPAPGDTEAAARQVADNAAEASEAAGKAVDAHAEAAEAAGREIEKSDVRRDYQQHMDTLTQEQQDQHEADTTEKWENSAEGEKAGKLRDRAVELRNQAAKQPKGAARDSLSKRADALEGQAESISSDFAHAARKDILAKAAKARADSAPERENERVQAEKENGGPSETTTEDPVKDRVRYEEIQARMSELAKTEAGNTSPEQKALFKENEAIKNRNSSDPGNPPEPIGKEPSEREEPEDPSMPPAKAEAPELGDQRVKLKVKRGNGSAVELEMSAKDAAKRVNDHIANLNRLKDCLGGKI